ncbi:MAG: hypothetical protein JW984_05555 [Deltaproteobacteria bacterium]|uniref:Uncharacterized protein n=1 Tax=Candidatus Zymogenus saltonus TaxID=2844893 RepID=A0A9D8KDR4_9DELT|nr:hypothetical protein [Candidatus Zymogenus saltonus]
MKSRRSDERGYSFYLLFPIAVIILLFPFLAGLCPIVRFTEEEIDIFVHQDHIEMRGAYIYSNPLPFPVMQGMSIPLPVDLDHPHPVLLSACEIYPESRDIPIRYILGKHRFDLKFKPRGEVRVLVRYCQHAPKRDARYILTTTGAWRHPLDRGMYRLFPGTVKIISSNYTLEGEASDSLFFSQTNFMPKSDWRFSWEVKP